MRLVKIALLIAVAFTLNAYEARAQGGEVRNEWEFSCRKFEERAWTQCGASVFSMEKRYALYSTKVTEVGRLTIVNRNRSRKDRNLEFLGFTPGHGPEDASKNWWFFGPKTGNVFRIGPGRKTNIQIHFAGCRATRPFAGHTGPLCTDPGTYEGAFKLKDTDTGAIYEFSITVYAFAPEKKTE